MSSKGSENWFDFFHIHKKKGMVFMMEDTLYMEETLYKVFPEFLWISDEELRVKCVRTWIAALAASGRMVESLYEMPFVTKGCTISMVDHVRAVTKIAVDLCDSLNQAYDTPVKTNRDYVAAGALLHDVGKLLEYGMTENGYGILPYGNYVRHPLGGAILAAQNNVPEEIIHIIATHSFEGDKSYKTRESYIVKTADWIQVDYLLFTYPNQVG